MPTLTCSQCGTIALHFDCATLAWTSTPMGNNAREHTVTVHAVCPTCNQPKWVTYEVVEDPIGIIEHMEAATMGCSFSEYCTPILPAPPVLPVNA